MTQISRMEALRRQDPTGVKLSVLENIMVKVEVAQSLQAQKDYPGIQIKGANMEEEAFHRLVVYLMTDPAHVSTVSAAVRLPHAKMIVTKSFAARWTDNPQHYRDHFGIDDVEVRG